MAYHLRWRKAALVSLVCHIFFFAGAGYLSAHFAPPVVQEQVIELELVSEREAQINEASPPASTPLKAPAPPEKVVQTTPAVPPQVQAAPRVVTSAEVAEALPVSDIASSNEPASAAASAADNTASSASSASSSSSGSGGKRGGYIPPSILSKVDPPYPQAARQSGMEGTVLLKIEILANGRAGTILLARSSGHGLLDEAAMRTVEQWRFVPAKDRSNGQAVACYTTIPISFRLQ